MHLNLTSDTSNWSVKIRWTFGSTLHLISGVAISVCVFGIPALLYITYNNVVPTYKFLLAFVASLLVCFLFFVCRKKYVWLLGDGLIKGFQFTGSRAFVTNAIRFTDVKYLDASVSTLLLSGPPYYIHASSKTGWFRGVTFEPKSAQDMATALEFLMLHVDRSVWDPELEDWAYSWLRKQGKHLPRIV